jgi:outer membrane lipoprotein-sorting protein
MFFLIPFVSTLWAAPSSPKGEVAADIIAKMEGAYAAVKEYQTETEVNEYREGRVVETKRFLYTFRKPDQVRIDMKSPYPGMILVYPDEDGKVYVRLSGLAGFLYLSLSPDSALLKNSAGQRIDQTNLGLLIRNLAHSFTDRRRGEIRVSREDGRVLVEVLAEDHFLASVLTLYHVSIDSARWLPVEVKESNPAGVTKRKVIFRNMRTSPGVPEGFFRIN